MEDARCMLLGGAQTGLEGEAALLARAQDGDRAALDDIYRRYRDRVFALCLNLTGSRDEAQDLLQETFLRAFRGLPRFAGRSQLHTWLYRITVNTAHELGRRRKRYQQEEALMLESPPADHDLVYDVRATIARLKPGHRAVLALYYGQGFSCREVADCLGWTVARTKITLYRARLAFKDAYLRTDE